MKTFLKKYLTEEQIAELERKYLAEHTDEKELPTYISKKRFDEVNTAKKAAEALNATKDEEITTYKTGTDAAVKKAVDEAKAAALKEKDEALALAKKDFDGTEAIYKARGRNVKAIKALIDPTKKIDEEITRLQKDEPYLFTSAADDIPPGTGKNGGAANKTKAQEDADMRAAVGIPAKKD